MQPPNTGERCSKCGSTQADVDKAQEIMGAGCPNYGCPMVPWNGLEGPSKPTKDKR